jgi:hypothetical protein
MNAVVEMRKVDSLKYDPNNVRLHTDRNVEVVKASYARFGQQRPILISEDGTVVAGNCQLAAARSLGWEEIQVQVTSLKDAREIKAYAIADNRTHEFGEWDFKGLSVQLKDLEDVDFDFDSVGFDEAEINRIFETADVEFPETNEQPEFEEKKEPKSEPQDTTAIHLTLKEDADAEDVKQAFGMINAVVMQFPGVFKEKSARMK